MQCILGDDGPLAEQQNASEVLGSGTHGQTGRDASERAARQ